jgi:hypothetical protein
LKIKVFLPRRHKGTKFFCNAEKSFVARELRHKENLRKKLLFDLNFCNETILEKELCDLVPLWQEKNKGEW